MANRKQSIRVDRHELIRVAERRLEKIVSAHKRALTRRDAAVETYAADVIAALEKALTAARAGKLPKSGYHGELQVACKPKPGELPKRSREACDLERTIATLRIGADDAVSLSPDDAAYYFGPCEV